MLRTNRTFSLYILTFFLFLPRYLSAQSIVLPIEIMGPDGTTESVSFSIDDPEGITGVWIQAHNLSYENKGSIQVNNGAWINLNNASVDVAEPEVHIGGIGGAYSTIRLTVPIDPGTVIQGVNTLSFQFNETDGLSSGWRVLQFNLIRSGGATVLSESLFSEDNPADWEPILKSSADIAEGEYLWYNAELVVNPGGAAIKARCADCHATDGRDLQYFSYSDKSIVSRSEFHGLTTKQGEQIASFIRSLDVPNPGRPWNPPYQPGPGLDDRPVEEWAAGAGLAWVLDDDAETMDYIFPAGITSEVTSTKSTLNMRELPLAMQFPDWNRWLPGVHPVDFWGDEFLSSDAWSQYAEQIPSMLAQGIDRAVASGTLKREIQSLDANVSDFREHTERPSGATAEEHAQGNLGLQLWQLVKVWEIMQVHDLEGRGLDFYPNGEERTWFSASRNVFNVAPHISSAPGADTYGSELLDKYFSHTWYTMQLIINPGNRDPLGHRPVDWKYQFGHIGDYAKQTGLPAGSRLVATYIKMIQMLDNDNPIGTTGWYIRHVHPYWFVKSLAVEPGVYSDIWRSIPAEDHAAIAEVMLRGFLDKTLAYDISEWPRGEGNTELEPATYVPQPYDGKGSIFDDRFNYADNFYKLIPEFHDRGVSASLLDSLAAWGEEVWPLGDWENLVDYTPPGDDDGGEEEGEDNGDDGGDGGDGQAFGDVNADGIISAADASLVLQYLEGILSLSDHQLEASEVSGDGRITVKDASLILRYVTGRIQCFPVESICTLAVRR